MKLRLLFFLFPLILGVSTLQAQHKTVTIAAVNNPDMIELKKLSSKFEQENPDITLQWVIVEENILRQRVTTDAARPIPTPAGLRSKTSAQAGQATANAAITSYRFTEQTLVLFF
jgi:ABC-type glycerol-3-phosphate transport system substrate-binding protein